MSIDVEENTRMTSAPASSVAMQTLGVTRRVICSLFFSFVGCWSEFDNFSYLKVHLVELNSLVNKFKLLRSFLFRILLRALNLWLHIGHLAIPQRGKLSDLLFAVRACFQLSSSSKRHQNWRQMHESLGQIIIFVEYPYSSFVPFVYGPLPSIQH